jgi:hypothetical protein
MEIDPGYVEVAINRWQDLAGETARHAETKRSLDELRQDRRHGSHSKRRRKRRKGRPSSDRKAQAEVRHGR